MRSIKCAKCGERFWTGNYAWNDSLYDLCDGCVSEHIRATESEAQGFIPAVEHPANQDRAAFMVQSERYGMMVEDAGCVCAGVQENGYDTLDDLVAAQGWEREAAMIEAERDAYWASDAGQMRMSD